MLKGMLRPNRLRPSSGQRMPKLSKAQCGNPKLLLSEVKMCELREFCAKGLVEWTGIPKPIPRVPWPVPSELGFLGGVLDGFLGVALAVPWRALGFLSVASMA